MTLIPPRRRIRSRAGKTTITLFAFALIGGLIVPDSLWNNIQPIARAASFTVNTLADTPDAAPGDGTCADSGGACTLRAAIQETNALPGDDTINFSVTGSINLNSALPNIASNIIIQGPGANTLTIQRSTAGGTPNFRIFTTNSGTVITISGLTITNGRTADGAPGGGFAPGYGGQGDNGGGILNNGALTLTEVVVTGNRTGGGGAGTSGTGGPGGYGGGIFSSGPLTMTRVTVSNNTAGNGAVGFFGGEGGKGGGIFFTGSGLTMTDCSVLGNAAGNGVGGTSGGSSGSGGDAGGINAEEGPVNLTNVIIDGNHAGDGAQPISSSGGRGGGLFTWPGVQTTMTNCTVSNNNSGQGGTGFSSQGGSGGGVDNFGPMTMVGCTISGNFTKGPSSGGGSWGAGIFNNNLLTITNCTISGNHTHPDVGRGGGIYNNGATVSLTNSTITGNSAPFGNGVVAGGTTNVRNTIIAGNGPGGNGPDLDPGFSNSTFTSQGHNLIGNADGSTGFTAPGDQVGTGAAPLNPQLGPLADNGGPTLTHALLVGSPALDAGNNALAKDASNNTLTTDQRGAGRFADSDDPDSTATVDIGAFEYHQTLENVSDKTTNEDTPLIFSFAVGGSGASVSSVAASSDNQALVPDANLSLTGAHGVRTLRITPLANLSGTAQITLTVVYAGGPVVTDTFQLTVTSVNDAPTFTKGGDQTVNEDSSAQTVPNWATAINAGPNESAQTLTFLVTDNTNASLFSAGPAISASGTLTYTPAPNASGSALVTIVLKDNGGTANGGQDTSAAQTFTINITAINDAPTFIKGADQTVNEDSGFHSISNWATGISPGPNESGQSLSFLVTGNTNPSLFLFGPSVSPFGTLSFSLAGNASGSAAITIVLQDTGGTTNGGQDTSPAQTFNINVTAVNDGPINSAPFLQFTNQNTALVFSPGNFNAITVSDVDAGTNPIRMTLTATQGTLTLGSTAGITFVTGDGTDDVTMSFTGTIANINAALNGLTFKPNTNFSGGASIQITSDDQGHTGSGGAKTDTDTVAINVRAGGTLQFSSASYAVNESAGTAVITIIRTGGSAGTATVLFETTNGTAHAADYTTVSQTVTFVDGDTSETVNIPITNDTVNEPDETVNLTLSNAGGSGALGAPAAAVLTIQNDDTPAFNLSQSAYVVAEDGLHIDITVNRSGDTSAAASVDYETSDLFGLANCATTNGNASERCDYLTAVGRLDFAAGATTESFRIFVNDDVRLEGAELFTLTLSNEVGGVLGGTSTATVTITDHVVAPGAANPIDDAAFFIRMLYVDILSREPDTLGFQGWLDTINGCPNGGFGNDNPQCDRVHVAQSFYQSLEFGERGYFIYRFYDAGLGRRPTYREFIRGMQQIGGSLSPAQSEVAKQEFIDDLMATAEFQGIYGGMLTPPQANAFITELENRSGTQIPEPARSQLVSNMANGTKTAAETLRAFIESQAIFDAFFNRGFVSMLYFGYLRRDPDTLGFNDWLQVVNLTGDYRALTFGFIYSNEYRGRFGP